jgi:hypothetical protein
MALALPDIPNTMAAVAAKAVTATPLMSFFRDFIGILLGSSLN